VRESRDRSQQNNSRHLVEAAARFAGSARDTNDDSVGQIAALRI